VSVAPQHRGAGFAVGKHSHTCNGGYGRWFRGSRTDSPPANATLTIQAPDADGNCDVRECPAAWIRVASVRYASPSR
jgi:hypothetical protein